MDLVSYVLAATAVLVVAAVATAVGLGALRVGVASAGALLARTPARRFVARRSVQRRCEACGRSWTSDGSSDPTVLGLRLRRRVRRRRREQGLDVPGWAVARAWSRCPSCLSARVRSSGEPWLPPKERDEARRLTALGVLVGALGIVVISLAVLGWLSR